MPQKKTTLKQRREIADGIFRRTFPALKHLMPSHTLHSVSRQIHALLSQQTTFKQFWWLFYSNQLNSLSLHKTSNL